MIAAFAWGFGAASSLILGAGISLRWRVHDKVLGLTMAFGSGVLLSAVAYDLVQESFRVAADGIAIAIGLALGALTFYVGDLLIDRMGGANRKRTETLDQSESPLAIVLGTVLDGIPESIVIGLTLVGGSTIDLALVIAVFMSNVPEAVAATTGLRGSGWRATKILGLWLIVALASGVASLAGFVLLGDAPGPAIALINSFAAGAILTMLADTMMPEAFKKGGPQAGLVTTLGFGLAFGLTVLD